MLFYKTSLLIADELLSFIGTAIILFAGLKAAFLFCKALFTDKIDVNSLRLELGYGIILGLEFMIGADIIESMVKPTYYDIGMLAILVVIRTFLSYFLGKELAELKPEKK